MNTSMKRVLVRGNIAIVLILALAGCFHNLKRSESAGYTCILKDIQTDSSFYYHMHTDSTENAWNDSTMIFHYWESMRQDDYLFGPFSSDSINSWIRLCEELNQLDNSADNIIPARYASLNQYVTIHDLLSVWSNRGYSGEYDDFTLWRVDQYRSDTLAPISITEKFRILKSTMDSICDFEPYFKYEYDNLFCLENQFQEIYYRMLLNVILERAGETIRKALLEEESTWKSYHAVMDSTYRIISDDPNGFNGSAWGQAIMQAKRDNAFIRECSLADYCFYGDELFNPEIHVPFLNGAVYGEYRRFINSLEENDYHNPVIVRKEALEREMMEWQKWMQSRETVSSLLTGREKFLYDNSTNNVRRMKYIMLKNCYEGYGVISNDVYELLIGYDIPDEELDCPSFNEKWKDLYGDTL